MIASHVIFMYLFTRQVLELKVMVDANLEPWLLKVDRSPNLACAATIKGMPVLAAAADRQVRQIGCRQKESNKDSLS